jgi:hypothetical protein
MPVAQSMAEEVKHAEEPPRGPVLNQQSLRLASFGGLNRGRKIQALLVENVGTIDVNNRTCRLPQDCDVIDSVWFEFPEGYKPAHAFGVCSALEDVGLYINEQPFVTVSCFDLFAFGKPGPYPNLIRLPLVPAVGLQLDAKPTLELRVTLKDPVQIKVLVGKKYYDASTRANPPVATTLMYTFCSTRAAIKEPGAVVPINAKHPTLQIAVALVDGVRGCMLPQATRVSLIADDVVFELNKVDPLNLNPKGIYTHTFESCSDACALPTWADVRTTFDMSNIKKAHVRITTEGLPDGCVAHISTLCENVLEDFKFKY